MGKINFRKTFKLGPININLSGKGTGVSAGVPGARITQRADGSTQLTTSIPGTGIIQRTTLSGKASVRQEPVVPPAAERLPMAGIARGTGESPVLSQYLIDRGDFFDPTPELFDLAHSEYTGLVPEDRGMGCMVVSQGLINLGMSKLGYTTEGAVKYIFHVAQAATNYYFDHQLFLKESTAFGLTTTILGEERHFAVIVDRSSHFILLLPDEARAMDIKQVLPNGMADLS